MYRLTRRVVSGQSKQYLLRPETTFLVTLYLTNDHKLFDTGTVHQKTVDPSREKV